MKSAALWERRGSWPCSTSSWMISGIHLIAFMISNANKLTNSCSKREHVLRRHIRPLSLTKGYVRQIPRGSVISYTFLNPYSTIFQLLSLGRHRAMENFAKEFEKDLSKTSARRGVSCLVFIGQLWQRGRTPSINHHIIMLKISTKKIVRGRSIASFFHD